MKTCSKCLLLLDDTCFSIKRGRPGQKDGLRSRCKNCTNNLHRARYHNNNTSAPKQKLPDNHKKCSQCASIKEIAHFHPCCKNPTSPWHYSSKCKDCDRKYQRTLKASGYRRPSESKLSSILMESKRKNVTNRNHRHGNKLIDFTIVLEDVEDLIAAQTINNNLHCAATGIPLTTESQNLLFPSIDRIDNTQGYTPGNIRIVSHMYNLARNHYDDIEFTGNYPHNQSDPHTIAVAIRKSPISRGKNPPKAEQLIELVQQHIQGGVLCCAATGEPCGPLKYHPFSPSLDRIDYNGDYSMDNLRIVTHSFNRGRNRFGFEESATAWKLILKSLRERHSCGYLYDDEWLAKRHLFIDSASTRSCRPQKLRFELINAPTANVFYGLHHYIGKCTATYHIGGFLDGELVCCMSLREPSRQLAGDWEIGRMARKNDLKINGLWSYLWSHILEIIDISGVVVSYSDNRLHDGKVYEHMKFTHVSDVPPDYYWVKNGKRHHKSKLRKTNSEKLTGLTETQLRTAQGYRKVYDLGKKKWEMSI